MPSPLSKDVFVHKPTGKKCVVIAYWNDNSVIIYLGNDEHKSVDVSEIEPFEDKRYEVRNNS